MSNTTIDVNSKKVSHRDMHTTATTPDRLAEFNRAHACIEDIITDPDTGVCYVKCVAGDKTIDVRGKYLVDDRVTVDDITFTKNPDIARRWILAGKNIGVYTGLDARDVIEDNVVILDIDLKDVAPDDDPEFLAPKDIIDNLVGRTLTIETRSGGLQCIFRNAIGATGSPRLRYVDPETGHLHDAGDTRIKHAYALFAGSYVSPDKITSKRDESNPNKPFKKPLPHADGLYRAIHTTPVIDLTHDLLNELQLAVGGRGKRARIQRTTSVAKDGETTTHAVNALRAYSSYGKRRCQYTLTHDRIQELASLAHIDYIRNNEGKTLESLSYQNDKIFNLIRARTDYMTRGVTNDESESAENIALAYEMRKLGFDSPDIVAMAILIYHPREKNFEIRSNGISYLADTVAGAFDHYEFEHSDAFSDDEILAASNAGSVPGDGIATPGRGYSHLHEFASDDPNITFETWTSFPPFAPTSSDIMLWRGDPRAGKSYHGTLYLSQHETGNYVTHRHEIIGGIFDNLVEMTSDTTKTIVWLEGKRRCCPHKTGVDGVVSCKNCPLRPSADDDGGGIPFLEYQYAASTILTKHRAINKDILLTNEGDFCPYYLLKFAEPEANYCLTVAPFISPITRPDTYSITPRDYLVIDEEPTIGVFYPAYPALYEYHRYGFASKWDTNHLVNDSIIGQMMDVKSIIREKNPKRVTKINKVIRDICEAIINLNKEIMQFSAMEVKGEREQEAFIRKVRPTLPTFEDLSPEFKRDVMVTFMEHLQDLKYPSTGDPAQYLQPFLYPAPDLLVWQQGSHPRSPKQILYLMSDHVPMFEPEFKKMLVIGATESEVFVDHVRGERSVCRVDLEVFPYQENYLLMVASGDSAAEEDRIVREVMATLLDRNRVATRDGENGVVPFIAVSGTKDRQSELLRDMAPHGKILGLGEYDTRDDVVRYYELGFPVAFYNNGTIARGVDLPEYDVLFFMDGGFATPRFSALEASARARGKTSDIKRYRNLRSFLVVDESTNSAYRSAPLYTRKAEKAKILVIARTTLGRIYDAIYKGSCLIPVEKDSIEKTVDLITQISSRIEFHRTNQDSQHCDYATSNTQSCLLGFQDSSNQDSRFGERGEVCYRIEKKRDWGTQVARLAEPDNVLSGKTALPTIYSTDDRSYCSTNCRLIPGMDYKLMSLTVKKSIHSLTNIIRDRRTQRTFDMVARSTLALLRGSKPTRSIPSIVTKIYPYKQLRNRRVSKATLTAMIEEMVMEGLLLCSEECDFSSLLSDDRIDSKKMVQINPDSPMVAKYVKD